MDSAREQRLSRRVIDFSGVAQTPSDLSEYELDLVEAAVVAAEQSGGSGAKLALADELSRIFHLNFERRVRIINDPLVPTGRFLVPTYLANSDVRNFVAACEAMSASGQLERPALLAQLLEELSRASTHPHYRAVHVYLSTRLTSTPPISHYLHVGTTHFYRQDYLSCMLVLLPAVEKLVLLHIGHLSDAIIGTDTMRSLIAKRTARVERRLQPRYAMYKSYVLGFVERFQLKAAKAGVTADGVNVFRNRIYHLAEDDRYYSYDDCVALLNLFDAYLEMLALEEASEVYGFVPDNPAVVSYSRQYWKAIFDDFMFPASSRNAVLKTFASFRDEARERNFLTLFSGPEQRLVAAQAVYRMDEPELAALMWSVGTMTDSQRKVLINDAIVGAGVAKAWAKTD